MLHRENTKANSRGLSSYLGLPDVRAVLRHGGVDSRRRAIPRGPTMHAPTSLLTHPLLTQSSLLNRFPGPNRRSRRGSTAATTSAPSPHTVSTKEVGRDLDVPLTMACSCAVHRSIVDRPIRWRARDPRQASVMWVPSVGWGGRFDDRKGAPTNWACPDPDARWTVRVQSAAADT